MYLSQVEIEDYARRFVEIPAQRTWPMDGDLFAILVRETELRKVLAPDENWSFVGYGISLGYSINDELKPLGRSLWWNYFELSSFPPRKVDFKLQAPQVINGIFPLQGGGKEMRIILIPKTIWTPPSLAPFGETVGSRIDPSSASLDKEPDFAIASIVEVNENENVMKSENSESPSDNPKILKFRPKGS